MILRRAEQQNLHVIGNGYEFFFVEESSSNHGHGENFSREEKVNGKEDRGEEVMIFVVWWSQI